jgi:hypothetical protein
MQKNRVMFLCGFLVLTSIIPLRAQDVIFGEAYGSLKAKYDKFPANLKQKCAHVDSAVNHFGYFAHYVSNGSEYYAVLDMSTKPSSDAYGYGSIILIHGPNCSEGDLDWALRGIPPSNGYQSGAELVEMPGLNAPKLAIPPDSGNMHYILRSAHEQEILRGLIRDSIQRAIKINGGDAPVRKTLCRPENLLADPEYPLVPQELSVYCGVKP